MEAPAGSRSAAVSPPPAVVEVPAKWGMVMRILQMRLQPPVEFQVLPEEQELAGLAAQVAELHPWVVVEPAGIRME